MDLLRKLYSNWIPVEKELAVLIRFEVTNFRSLRDATELSMVAVDREREIVRDFESLSEGLLPVAGIYGPNASGKSNVVSALEWFVNTLPNSRRYWDESIPTEPFIFDRNLTEPTKFEIDMMVGGIRFTYRLELAHDRVHREGLWHYPKGRKRKIFLRDGKTFTFQPGLSELAGIRQLLTSRTLALSLAYRFESPTVSDFVNMLLGIHISNGSNEGNSLTHQLFESVESGPARDQALALLRLADLGIADVVVDRISHYDPQTGQQRQIPRLRLLHETLATPVPIEFGHESEGTQSWFRCIGPVLQALTQGSLLVVDEIDSSLHPKLTGALVGLFTDPETNPRGAQLIFTAHDTNLLGQLNRDEIWLTEKNADGSTHLGALAEFAGESVRRSVNIGPAYLAGRFGSLPQIYPGDLLKTFEKLM